MSLKNYAVNAYWKKTNIEMEEEIGLDFINFKQLELFKYTVLRCAICYHLYNLKKREKHPWRSVTHSKVASNTLHVCFSRFLNCRNGTKSHKTSPLSERHSCEFLLSGKVLILVSCSIYSC